MTCPTFPNEVSSASQKDSVSTAILPEVTASGTASNSKSVNTADGRNSIPDATCKDSVANSIHQMNSENVVTGGSSIEDVDVDFAVDVQSISPDSDVRTRTADNKQLEEECTKIMTSKKDMQTELQIFLQDVSAVKTTVDMLILKNPDLKERLTSSCIEILMSMSSSFESTFNPNDTQADKETLE